MNLRRGALGLLLIGSLFRVALDASSKSEAALRAQLAEAQAQIAKLSQTNAARSASQAKQTANVREAQNDNAGKAQDAVSEAQDAVVEAQAAAAKQERASAQAVVAAAAAQSKANATLITAVGGFLTLLAPLLWQGYIQARNHKWETEATAAHRKLEMARIGDVQVVAMSALRAANTVNRTVSKLAPAPVALAARKVLLVDDDPELGFLVEVAAAHCPAPVTLDSALDGATALGKLHASAYDLLLLDLSLGPGLSGLDVLSAAKAIQPLPIVILTADASDETFVRSLNCGAADVLVKPFTTDGLAAQLQCYFNALPETRSKT